MKRMWLSVGLVLGLALPASAQDKEADRVENAGKVLKEILSAPDSIPQSVLDKADCVVILPSVLKFAIGFGGSYGRGVMTCRGGAKFHGPWSAPAMMALEGGSVGLQLGGNATDFVLLLMSPRSATSILSSKVKIGGDATRAEILSYSRARGLFAGISLAGSTLRPDNGANKNLYGKEVSAKSIVFQKAVPVPSCAKELLATLQKASPINKSGK
jgi:lipid-binding SYLF domain-containing protein